MENPLVSIIIPTYNASAYIADAVDSAVKQTYLNKEIIVVDDGSTDDTKKILAPYIRDGFIKYIFQKNKGLSGARNTAIREANGEYIALLDADDFFLPEKVERQIRYLETHTECDISYCDLYHFYEDNPLKLLKLQYNYYSGNDVLLHLIKGNFIAPLAVVLRKNVFDRFGYFDENLKRSEDLEFWIRVALNGGRICFLPEILGKLRMRKTGNLQDSKGQPAVKLTNLEILDHLNSEMNKIEKKKYKLNYYRGMYAFKTAAAHLLNGEKKSAYLFVNKALFVYPLNFPICIIFYLIILLFPNRFFPWFFKLYYRVKHSVIFKRANVKV
ncbi:MAG: hypothetical protein COU42_00605 [Candidatus Nealsonbacteria bacterium CG10_big_fil_rev_8_21_14_0_10_36_24]|uniref:Glycosyltransferase 2-like domain-containing protein n=1 Tax=Candidatus Nealsonbacteria bacterium CG10_big_fil_rev_8_21_14_0_10_36_24 TaxID=1974710 RepID=A0A2M6NSI9_9BACT|nr:MAG: hypothetical protein COU42_00605 [Candidatus Nealsonbacteria bacterium CG10_big_fil_rev_8_21_14_0_10_36_24]